MFGFPLKPLKHIFGWLNWVLLHVLFSLEVLLPTTFSGKLSMLQKQQMGCFSKPQFGQQHLWKIINAHSLLPQLKHDTSYIVFFFWVFDGDKILSCFVIAICTSLFSSLVLLSTFVPVFGNFWYLNLYISFP